MPDRFPLGCPFAWCQRYDDEMSREEYREHLRGSCELRAEYRDGLERGIEAVEVPADV